MVNSFQYFNIKIFECVCLTKDQLKIQIQIKVELKWVDILFTNKVELIWEFYASWLHVHELYTLDVVITVGVKLLPPPRGFRRVC